MLAALLVNLPTVAPEVIPEIPGPLPAGGFIKPKKAKKLKLRIDPGEKTELFEGTKEPPPRPSLPAATLRSKPYKAPTPAHVALKRAMSPLMSVDSRVRAVRRLRDTGRISETEEEEALMIILMSI